MEVYDWGRGVVVDSESGVVEGVLYAPPGRGWGGVAAPPPGGPRLGRGRLRVLRGVLGLLESLRGRLGRLPPLGVLEGTVRLVLSRLGYVECTREFQLAVAYTALQLHRVYVDSYTLARLHGVSPARLASAILRVKRLLGHSTPKPTPREVMLSLLRHYTQTLGVPFDAARAAAERIKSKPYPQRLTPRALVLAILHIELERRGHPTRKVDSQLHPRTLRKALETAKKHYYNNNDNNQ